MCVGKVSKSSATNRPYTPEDRKPQGLSNVGSNGQREYQGICPHGWHVPSDREWTILESEIIKNTRKYGYAATNLYDDDPSILPLKEFEVGAFGRGNAGLIFKSVCGAPIDQSVSQQFLGKSPTAAMGGLAIEYAGYIKDGKSVDFYFIGILWTSSSGRVDSTVGHSLAFRREFGSRWYAFHREITRGEYDSSHLCSVRKRHCFTKCITTNNTTQYVDEIRIDLSILLFRTGLILVSKCKN